MSQPVAYSLIQMECEHSQRNSTLRGLAPAARYSVIGQPYTLLNALHTGNGSQNGEKNKLNFHFWPSQSH